MIKLLDLEVYSDERGSLVAIESLKDISFEIKRIYYLFNGKINIERGKHAHKNLKQIYIAISGSCKIEFDDGTKKFDYFLDSPTKCLVIDEVVWREIRNLTSDCVLLVLADDFYKDSDYIRDYNQFLEYIGKK